MTEIFPAFLLFLTIQVGFIYQCISCAFPQGRLTIDFGNLKRNDRQDLPIIR